MRVQERLRPGGHRCYWLKRWSSPIFGCSVRGGTETPGCSPSVTLPGDNRDDGPGAKPDNLHVIIQEVPKENWALAGVMGDERKD